MSGGHYDYAYTRVQDMAVALIGRGDSSALLRAFGEHLLKVAKAMRDVEWEHSGDGADWQASVRAVLAPGAELEAATKRLRDAMDEAEGLLAATHS